MAVDIGEPEVAALVAVGEPLVLDAHEVHERGVEVVHMHRLVDDVVAVVVGFSVGDAGLRAAAGEPHGEATRMVVAAVIVLCKDALAVGGAAEFSAPDDERVVEHAEAFEVLDERGLRLVGILALPAELGGKIEMLVPAAVVELHKPNVALGEAAGHEAVVGVGARGLHIGSIHVERLLGFVREIGEFRHGGLHAVGHFVLGNAGDDLGVHALVGLLVVLTGELVEHAAAVGAVDAIRILEEKNRLAAAAEVDALVLAGQEARTPQARGDELRVAAALADHHDEGRQVFVHAAEAVADPGAERRAAGELVSALEKRHAGLVVDLLSEDRVDYAEVLRDAGRVGVEFGNPEAVLVILVFFKLENRRCDRQAGLARGHAGDALIAAHGFWEVLVELRREAGFVVENIHLRRTAVLEEVDDPLGLRREVRGAEKAALERARWRCENIIVQDRAQRHGADALRHFSKKLTPADVEEVFFDGISHRSWWVGQSIAGNCFIEI